MDELFDDSYQETAIPEWLLPVEYNGIDVDNRSKLNFELYFLEKWLSLSKEEMHLRDEIQQEIRQIVNVTLPNCKLEVVGSTKSKMVMPDSNIDFVIESTNFKIDAIKLFKALTVSTKYQEILQKEVDSGILIDCKHSATGISVHIEVGSSFTNLFSNFILYAGRITVFKPLYLIFRHFLKQNNIQSDGNHNMLIYLLIIYYLQIFREGKIESLDIGDLFLDLLHSIYNSKLLSINPNLAGYTFVRYLHSVEPKLDIHIDITSKSMQHLLERITRLCQNSYEILHKSLEINHYKGWISTTVFHNFPRISASMRESSYLDLVGLNTQVHVPVSYGYDSLSKDDNLKLIVILVVLLIITLLFIVILLYLKSKATSNSNAPQIVLGSFIESKDIYI